MSPHATPLNAEENGTPASCAAPGAARSLLEADMDPNLVLIIDRWKHLPAAVRAGIVAMVRDAADDAE